MIVWIVALRVEAAPLLGGFGLRAHPRPTPWPLYLDDDGEAALVVSGVGRTAAAAACGWAQGFLSPPSSTAWINAGVAGHSAGPVGRALLAHRVVDVAADRVWYPPPVPGVALESDTLFTVDRPESGFEVAGAYDMEAAGFLAAASRCAPAELTQVVKVVSDTRDMAPTELGREEVSALMETRLEELRGVADALAALGRTIRRLGVEA